MVERKDYIIGVVTGFFTGFLVLCIFSFLKIDFKFKELFFLFIIPVLSASGIWLGRFLSKWFPFFSQFGKFVAVGFLSSSIDFSILNVVSFFTGITAGIIVGWVNIPGFMLATLNGYLLNKFWVFQKTEGKIFGDFPKFLGVALIGLLINSSIIIVFTTFLTQFGISKQVWLNLSKVAATAAALFWNFIGYRFIVFKKYV